MTATPQPSLSEPAVPIAQVVDFVVIDVETACSRVSSICQVGIVGFAGGRERWCYETLVDPCDDFHDFNVRIHGIGPDHVMGHPTFADIHGLLDGHLSGRITVAHSYFDKGALAAACRVHDRPAIETRWLDSVRVAKRAWPDLPSHRLNVLSDYLGVAHKHHDALSDARAAGMVIVKAIDHTGIDLLGWMAPSTKAGPAPTPAASGPLRGERIAIAGEPRDSRLAQRLAAAGGRIVSSVGATTTLLVLAEPPSPLEAERRSRLLAKAAALRKGGHGIAVIGEHDMVARIGSVA
jgi:DNA polymerase-3 subunit epsilon